MENYDEPEPLPEVPEMSEAPDEVPDDVPESSDISDPLSEASDLPTESTDVTDAVPDDIPEDPADQPWITIHPGNTPETLPPIEVEPYSIPNPEGGPPKPPEGWHPGGPEGGY
jgi:hypothetical protein